MISVMHHPSDLTEQPNDATHKTAYDPFAKIFISYVDTDVSFI